MSANTDVMTLTAEEQDKHDKYSTMIHEIRQDLKDLHEYWCARRRGLELREDNPYNGNQKLRFVCVPAKLVLVVSLHQLHTS